MNNESLFRIFVALVLLTLTAPASSHHAFATQFDASKQIRLVGTITSVDWRNPHTWFYIDVMDDAGNVTNWGLELASPNLLMRNGWSRSTMKQGDTVTVEGFHARDGSNTGNAQAITINETGRSLFTGSNAPREE